MAQGLFGGFILGFLGTAMPRMLSAPSLGVPNVLVLLTLYAAMVVALAFHKFTVGGCFFLAVLLVFIALMLLRVRKREDNPPPGFILVALAILCALAGSILSILESRMDEGGAFWVDLGRRLTYQAFVLLPILGIGPFLLPRFFGLQSPHNLPESKSPSKAWIKKAALALGVGLLIVASIFIELKGWVRTAHGLRFLTTLSYLAFEFPFRLAPGFSNALGACLHIAFAALISGFLLIALFPQWRVGLLHLTLVGGFAVITFAVATRVLFGHSGNLEKLKGRNRWLLLAVGLMLFAMATRISGDFWPKIMASHYIYGAVLWVAGVSVWSFFALPKILETEPE
jgi:hypothetical protein